MIERLLWDHRNFDCPEVLAREIQAFFSPTALVGISQQLDTQSATLVGHNSNRYLICRDRETLQLLHNRCLHKNARLISSGESIQPGRLVCPIHRWCYDRSGQLTEIPLPGGNGTRKLEPRPEGLSINTKTPLQQFRHLLFCRADLVANLEKSSLLAALDIEKQQIQKTSVQLFRGNWKEYGLVYNDNSHIRDWHPQMAGLLDLDSIRWEINDDFNVCTLQRQRRWRERSSELVEIHKLIGHCRPDLASADAGELGVAFVSIYPNIFIEFWPGFSSIDILEPLSVDRYRLHTISLVCPELAADPHAAEACVRALQQVDQEDNRILARLHDGRRDAARGGCRYVEYALEATELGSCHYLAWLDRHGGDFYKGHLQRERL